MDRIKTALQNQKQNVVVVAVNTAIKALSPRVKAVSKYLQQDNIYSWECLTSLQYGVADRISNIIGWTWISRNLD